MNRIYERDIDELFLRQFRENPHFLEVFIRAADLRLNASERLQIRSQVKHKCDPGTIDFEISYGASYALLIENKIDAGCSTTLSGLGQPERYQRSKEQLRREGIIALTILVAPNSYCERTTFSRKFDICISYEDLRPLLKFDDLLLLNAAIIQAQTPYEPDPNQASADFFSGFKVFAQKQYPSLYIKKDPNPGNIRPIGSHTIYFDVQKTLINYVGIPTIRMSLQCWDSAQPSASVKIMIGKWGKFCHQIEHPSTLTEIGAYLRRANFSLGIVIDTPRLDTQVNINSQLEDVVAGLEGAVRLQNWWRNNPDVVRNWAKHCNELSVGAIG